jgi:hypothetical protein
MNRNTRNKTILAVILFVSLTLLISPVFGSFVMWSQNYGTEEAEEGTSIVQTSDGGYAIAGGAMDIGVSYDFWLVKTDENGNILWTQKYRAGNGLEIARSLVQTPDGGYALVGETYSLGAGSDDFWLVKTDEYGNIQWNRTYGGTNSDQANSLIVTSDGGFAIVGKTNSYGSGHSDYWLVKTDANGIRQWNKTYGGALYDFAYSLVESSDGGFVIAGYTGSVFDFVAFDVWLVKTDEFGNMVWNQTYGGINDDFVFSVVETSDGGYALAGYTTSFGTGRADAWLIKTDPNGNMEWNKTYGGIWDESVKSVIETSDGGYALAGHMTTGNVTEHPFHVEDFWLIRTDESGIVLWNYTYGIDWDDRAQSIIETSDGGFALAGYSLPGSNMNFFVIKTNEYGIIPEFPSWTILPILLGSSLVIVIFRSKFQRRRPY